MKVTGRNGRTYEMPQEELRANLTARVGLGRWIPRRQWSVAHLRFYRSPNGKVVITLGGDIFTWGITMGRLNVHWDRDYVP